MINLSDAIISFYCKILIVDLQSKKFEPIQVPENEQEFISTTDNIDEYLAWFQDTLLHPSDKEAFERFELKVGNHIIYRRKCENGFVHSLMEIRPYSDKALLYVRDIENIYSVEYTKIAEQVGRQDAMTGLLTRKAFDCDIYELEPQNIGVIFCDLNGLKYTNDNISHEAGDKLILEMANLLKSAFPDYSSYRVGGDEFIIISYKAELRNFVSRVVGWHRWLWMNKETPIASVGYAIDTNTNNIHSVIEEAEKAMYVDKQIFYERYPKYKRRN